jgi:polysaccharide pyruvyl transferase WcaK-like protein
MKTQSNNHVSKTFKCILWGGYAFGNAGDELTLAVALRDMQQRFDGSVAILSPVPGYTKALFPETEVISFVPHREDRHILNKVVRTATRALGIPENKHRFGGQSITVQGGPWVEAIRQTDLLYLVGGGYLSDLFDLEFFLLPAQLAAVFGISVETAPLGIGPFYKPWSRSKLREVLKTAKVTVRDEESRVVCEEAGVTAKLGQDDGFRALEVLDLATAPANKKRLIGLNFFSQYGATDKKKNETWWVELLSVLKARSLPVEGFCFHNSLGSDFAQTCRLFEQAGFPVGQVARPDMDFRDACRRVANYSLVVTTRFHAAVVAGLANVPAVAVYDGPYYAPKMFVACPGNPRSRAVNLAYTQPATVVEAIENLAACSTFASRSLSENVHIGHVGGAALANV